MRQLTKPILYYDSQCKFCSKTKEIVSRLDSKNVNFRPLTTQSIKEFQNTLSISENISENVMYYKNKEGSIFFGSYAFFEYLKDKKGFSHFLGILGDFPLIKWFAKEVYFCIAVHRYDISKFL